MAIKNMAASVLSRLKAQAKEEKIPFQMILQLFIQEEFLRKLSISAYAKDMILKGGMFIYTLTEFESRPTRDIDFLVKNLHASLENIEKIMGEICKVDTGNDFITMDVIGTEQISVDKKYPGIKTKFMGRIMNLRIPFSIDVGIDDIIVPNPVMRKIITRLSDFESPIVYTYSLESTIAEKFDAILQRMAGTSRMKDFYDIYYLSGIFDFDGSVLLDAVRSTLKHRKRETPTDAFIDIVGFVNDEYLLTQWQAFGPAKIAKLSFEDNIQRIKLFLEPVYDCIVGQKTFDLTWKCEEQVWK